VNLLRKAGFKRIFCYQTISGMPDKMVSVEKPEKGFGKGGFVVISAFIDSFSASGYDKK